MSKSNIEVLLGEWGAWKRGENRQALGYPSRTSIHNLGVDGQRGAEPDVLLVDDDLRRLDRCIDALYPEAKRVVVADYVWAGPVKAKLDRLGVSRTVYYDMLGSAKKQLSHWMGEGYDLSGNYFVRTPCETIRTESY